MEDKSKKLIEIIKLVDDGLTKNSFLEAFKRVWDEVQNVKDTNQKEFNAIHGAVTSFIAKLKGEKDLHIANLTRESKDILADHAKDINDKLASIRQPKDGENGQDAMPVDEDAMVARVQSQIVVPTTQEIVEQIPVLGERTRDALELLQGDDRLDASAIKNLPDVVKTFNEQFGTRNVGGHGALYTLSDVDLSGIAPGQSIIWNGQLWLPYTPSSGGGSGYQQPTSGNVDGTNTVFVFATAPKVITVDGGRAMQKVSSDGTVNWTGTTSITLTIAPTFDVFAIA